MSQNPSAQDKAKRRAVTGLYVHVPFCARTCDYCAFYQESPDAEGIAAYLQGIAKERDLSGHTDGFETVFWGGGTPGLLSAKDLARLAEYSRAGSVQEWTVEMTPLAATEARLEALKAAGVTRISLGVQSFRPELLKALGRDHNPEQALRAVERVRTAGFASLNLDLMFALPGQSDAEWLEDLDQAVRLGPDHISTYCLTFEEDTKLWVKLSEGRLRRDIEAEARLYETTWDRLGEAGFAQYEISNFAKAGHACIHNLNTWRMEEWLGLGPSAASQYRGQRGSNVSDTRRWLELLGEGRRATEDRCELKQSLLCEDALIFGLRMNEGVDLALLKERFPAVAWRKLETLCDRLLGEGLTNLQEGHLRLSARGRLLADSVGAEFAGLLS